MPGAPSHITNYAYNDSYSSCGGSAPPSGNTNAYLTQITDPLGHSQKFCYGYNDGQLRGSADPNNQPTTYQYNDSLGRLISTLYYNNRLQPCRISVKSSGSAPANCADSTNVGNVLDYNYNFNLGSGDNGNVMGITNNRDNTRSQVFSYDAINRLQTSGTVNTSGTHCWGEQYAYDAWANLEALNGEPGYASTCGFELPYAYTMNAKNQIASPTSFTYDASGNLTASSWGASYTYNAESQLISTAGFTYVYDGDGHRVEKVVGGSVQKIYWYGDGSVALDETDGTGSTTNSSFNEYIFFGGTRTARRDSSGDVFYYLADHLGTSRVIAEVPSGQSAAALCYDADFYPYGGQMAYTDSCDSAYKFTGKERDTESGLDNFGARYYGSSFGRFLSADWSSVPAPVPYANLTNPQTLNLYAIVRDNPETFADLDGHCWNWICRNLVNGNVHTSENTSQGTRNSAQIQAQQQAQQQNTGAAKKPSVWQRVKKWLAGGTAAGVVRPAPGANPTSVAESSAAKQFGKPGGTRGPQPLNESPNPADPAPTIVPGQNSPGVPIGTTEGTKLVPNPETMTAAERALYVVMQALRAFGGAASDVVIVVNPRDVNFTPPPCPGCPQSGQIQ